MRFIAYFVLCASLVLCNMGGCNTKRDKTPLESWWWIAPGADGYAERVEHIGRIGGTAVNITLGSWQCDQAAFERVEANLEVIRASKIPAVIVWDTMVGFGAGPVTGKRIDGLVPTDPRYPAAAATFVEAAEAFLERELPGVQRVYWLEDEAKRARRPGEPAGNYYLREGQTEYVGLCLTVASAIKQRCPEAILAADGFPWPELRPYVKTWAIPKDYEVDGLIRHMSANPEFHVLGYWNTVGMPEPPQSPTIFGMQKLCSWLRDVGCKGALFWRYDKTGAELWARCFN